MMDMMQGMWGMGGMMLLSALFFIAVIVAVCAWWAARRSQRAPADAALQALRERYARGEINRDEFETKRRDLSA